VINEGSSEFNPSIFLGEIATVTESLLDAHWILADQLGPSAFYARPDGDRQITRISDCRED